MTDERSFVWGTAASSTQAEGMAPGSDWAWLADRGLVPPLPGNGFGDRFRDDFALYAAHGLRHHRLSLEWARLEPEPGRRDRAAVAHYRDVLGAAHDAGVAPWVCLLHFTTPAWFGVDEGGFTGDRDRVLDAFGAHAAFVAETFGDLVAGWQPVNEPHAFVTAYLAPQHPALQARDEVDRVLETVHLAAATAARAVAATGRPVATIQDLSPLHVAAATEPATAAAAREGQLMWQAWNRADLLEPFDLLGFSYYHAVGFDADGGRCPWPPDAAAGDMGYVPWPPGLGEVLHRLHDEQPLPILVAELGIGTTDDARRQRYLDDALRELADARASGVDVRGCFFWTGVDNDEWLHTDRVPFGLFDRQRRPRPSMRAVEEHVGAADAGV